TRVTDRNGLVTTIERDRASNPIAIVASGGQRTELSVNADGYLSRIANPAGDTFGLDYTHDGLMTTFTVPRTFTDPGGNVHHFAHNFAYDSQGRLARDENPAGGLTVLDRRETDDGHIVTAITALLRSSTYLVEQLPTGDLHRVITAA